MTFAQYCILILRSKTVLKENTVQLSSDKGCAYDLQKLHICEWKTNPGLSHIIS